MPIVSTPPAEFLSSPPTPSSDAFVIFYSSIDPKTGQMWCPDCRHVESTVNWLFGGEQNPTLYIIYVGSKQEWKLPVHNRFRLEYDVQSIPTMIKFKQGKEVARLDEDGILNKDALGVFFDA